METANRKQTETMKEAALEAGKVIMQIYGRMDLEVEYKADFSPLTAADKAAHDCIKSKLAVTGIPVLSEEGTRIPYPERKGWKTFWLIDPLDGTKEFISHSKEFTVNIALVQNNKPMIGVVYAPALDLLYWSDYDGNAWKQQESQSIQQIRTKNNNVIQHIVASKSHLTPETEQFIRKHPEAKIQTIGSSLKFMLVAEGVADCYPRFGPTMEWDTAAAQAIVESAGGMVLCHPNGKPLHYNKEDLLNPWFVAYG